MTQLVEISRVAAMLNGRARDIVHRLGLEGRVEHHEFVALNPTRADSHLGSFRICLTGAKAGIWKDFASHDAKGDALDLVAYCLFHGDKRQALDWARSFLGLDGADPEALRRSRVAYEKHTATLEQADAAAEKRRKSIKRIWLDAQPKLAGTPVERYLLGRGLDLSQLGRQPAALRYHPALYCRETDRQYPAMVAMIDRGSDLVGIHRTYLAMQPSGAVIKPPELGKNAKLSLGHYKGGLIKLWRGASGKPLKDAPAGEFVALSEGIEDGLSVALAKPELRVCCAVSLGSMMSLELPPHLNVLILGQNDQADSQAAQTLVAVVARFRHEGRSVRHALPPPEFKDWNDMAKAQAHAVRGIEEARA